jgi:hypothetical protein
VVHVLASTDRIAPSFVGRQIGDVETELRARLEASRESIARTSGSRFRLRTVVRTSCPPRSSAAIVCTPTKPEPPVTNTVLMVVSSFVSSIAHARCARQRDRP